MSKKVKGIGIACGLVLSIGNLAVAHAETLVQKDNLEYKGAFRIPAGDFGSPRYHGFTSGGRSVAYNPANDSLFMEGRQTDSLVAELSIPTPVLSNTLTALPTARVLQNFADPTEGNRKNIISHERGSDAVIETSGTTSTITINSLDLTGLSIAKQQARAIRLAGGNGFIPGSYTIQSVSGHTVKVNGNVGTAGSTAGNWVLDYSASAYLGGLMVYGGELVGTVYAYYDASNSTGLSHYKRSTTLTDPSYSGMWQVGTYPSPIRDCGFVSGPMTEIPDNGAMGGTDWKAALGGPVLTASPAGASIVSRLSLGPSAFVFDPARQGVDEPVPASAYMYYDLPNHATLGDSGGSGGLGLYDSATVITGVVFPSGTKSILYFGRKGVGEWHYGYGTNNPAQVGPPVLGALCGSHVMTQGDVDAYDYCAYDPSASAKGPHSYPYKYFVWAYNAEDFMKVKNGDTNSATGQAYKPWEVVPYATWSFDLPFQPTVTDSNGATVLGMVDIRGAAYDSNSQRIFISQGGGDGALPLVHVFKLNLADQSIVVPTPGGTSETAVNPAADSELPTVSVVNPVDKMLVNGTVVVSTNAADNVGVTKVELYVNGILYGLYGSAPYEISWNTASFSNGQYTIEAKAYDAAGNVAVSPAVTVNVYNDTSAPTASITSPATSTVSSGAMVVSAAATDDVAVTKVEFYVNGALQGTSTTAPYIFNWNTASLANGSYTLSVKAYDAAGNVGQSVDATLMVFNDSSAPTVNFIAPSSTYVYGSSVNIQASASDNVKVARMELYIDGYLQFSTTSKSFNFGYKLGMGKHTLTVKAYDTSNNVNTASKSITRYF